MVTLLDLIGTFAFAMSGALTAMNKKLDPFGILIIAFVTSIGGGTIRDIMIGRTPVGWMRDLNYLYAINLGYVMALIFKQKLLRLRISLLLTDTIGLGVFTLIGIQKGLDYGIHPFICVALGTITACFGGILRDVLCAEIPVVFRKEIYATICILGGIVFFVLQSMAFNENVVYLATSLVIIVIRLLAVKFDWSFPTFEPKS
ncbi:trimeric intracellular cation channel family protein [Flavobacterium restrictum]|uniref:Trimeric intracellular cation channel family protein n=1 Tax=Flavobacterium restrictum TaxID=2594428 RepID=A0A553EBI5_9FLAO|nr:trimeric intracellular cation channel family protein [Flavobacterium restrictum]TRX42408.1 trimeric intracellular cation channel family protein [Flavobacterium restrictum]